VSFPHISCQYQDQAIQLFWVSAMKKTISLLAVALAAAFLWEEICRAAQITDVQVFSEDEYVRLAISLDQVTKANVEINAAENLVFVRFDKIGIENLSKQSFLYENDPHLKSVTFLPLGKETTVVRVKARHPFNVKTYEIKSPPRFILELSEHELSQQRGPVVSMFDKGYYVRGVSQMQKGSYNSALMSFRSAIQTGNRVADSYYQAGLIRYRLGQYDKALINFNRAQKSGSFGDEARLYLSWIHYKNGDQGRFTESWKSFISNLPDENERMSLATAHPEIDYRTMEKAIKEELNSRAGEVSSTSVIENTADRGPRQDATVCFAKGLAAKEEGRLEEAAQFLEEAVSLDDSYIEAHFQLGVVYKALGKSKLSVQHFEKSLGNPGGKCNKTGEPVTTKEEPSAGRDQQQILDFQPVTENAARDNNPDDDREDSVHAGLVSENGSGGESTAQPAEGQAGDQSTRLASLRQAVANVISLPDVSLLRRQVKILAVILGVLFVLTLVGERITLRRYGRPRKVAPNFMIEEQVKPDPGSQNSSAPRPPAPAAERKRQMEIVLAKELAAKKRASQPAVEEKASGLELHLQPAGQRGMYGADIAGRIKEQLSRKDRPESAGSPSTPFGAGRDDLQTRLIRQLRSRNWTISDIAQEMNLSREEIKWALAGSSKAERTQSGKTGGKTPASRYSQARTLLEGKKESYQGIKPERIDREVDLELEINV